jgi:hypothetical protein
VYGRTLTDARGTKQGTLHFGVSGLLWRNALIMYDRETNSYWSHLTGEAVQGKLKGNTLEMIAGVPRSTWGAWKKQHPKTKLLSVGGRTSRPTDAYADYHASDRTGLVPVERTDARLRPKDTVIGVRLSKTEFAAVPLRAFPEAGAWVEPKQAWLAWRDPKGFASTVWRAKSKSGVVHFKVGWTHGRTVMDVAEEVSPEATPEATPEASTEATTWDLRTGKATAGPRKGEHL